MKIKKLIEDLPITLFSGSKETVITGLTNDSKRVFPGNLFVAKKGREHNGDDFIQEAVQTGARAILTDEPNPFLKHVTQLVTSDVTACEPILAARYYENPSQKLFTVGITGTNGKTTTNTLVRHFLNSASISCGLIGTIEYIVGDVHYPATLTTPDVITTTKLLKEMVTHGLKAATMEVSSIGLDQGRVALVDFDVALFTNLTHEHLDYHKTLEAYGKAKAKLFANLSADKVAVVPYNDPNLSVILEECRAKVVTFGFDPKADLYAHNITLQQDKTTFEVTYNSESVSFTSPLIGRFNIKNVLTAVGAALQAGLSLGQLSKALPSFHSARGRFERVDNPQQLNVIVDYAHTEDALQTALTTLKEVTEGRLITVFGCGGDRDTSKRSHMGECADAHSDFSIVTNDNPRGEDPEEIGRQIVANMDPKRYALILDRKEAIAKALSMATKKDTVLIAGKGHERVQIFANRSFPFDDVSIVKEVLKLS